MPDPRASRRRIVFLVGFFLVFGGTAFWLWLRPPGASSRGSADSVGGAHVGPPNGSSAGQTVEERLERLRILASVHYTNSRLEDPRMRDEILRAVDDAEECVRLAPESDLDRLNLAITLLRFFDEKKLHADPGSPPGTDPGAGAPWIATAKPRLERALALLAQVRQKRPDLAVAAFHEAMALVRLGKLEAADPASTWEARFRASADAYLAKEDRSSALRYHLGFLQFKAGRYDEAERDLRRAIEIDPDHPNAYNSLGLSLARQGKPREEIDPIFERHRALQEEIGKQRAQWDPDAVFDAAFPELVIVASSTPAPLVDGASRFERADAPGPAIHALAVLRGDPAFVPGGVSQMGDAAAMARASLLAIARDGASISWRLEGGRPALSREAALPAGAVGVLGSVSFDLDGDHFLDVVLATETGLRALRASGPRAEDGYEPIDLDGVPDDLGPVRDLLAADLDSDGDLDLVAVAGTAQASSLRVLRNDSQPQPAPAETPPENLLFVPRFHDVAAESGIAVDAAAQALRVVPLDFDGRNDADVLVVGRSESSLFANRRGFRFERAATLPGAEDGATGDLDGDGLTDVVLATRDGLVLARSRGTGLDAPATLHTERLASPRVSLVDLSNRGALDVLCFSEDRVTVLRSQGTGAFSDVSSRLFPAGFSGTPTGIVATDLDDDFDLDLVVPRAEGPATIYAHLGGETSPAIALAFRGTKTNRAGIGTKVEARAGGLRVRREVWSLPAWIAVGPRPRIDGVFLKWTNGIDEASGSVPTGRWHFAIERRGREGSCPFVFSWNGERFEFVTDALGATPLGLQAAPGVWVPPQDREWLRIRGDQLVPRDGRYEIRFTEEMREVTYLDRVRLLCVDHPAGTDVFPDERFCFPPFPEKRLLVVREARPVFAARDGRGDDVTDALAREDRRFVGPPERIGYQGMATEHALELDLGEVGGEPALRLFLTGWFAWTNSSINRAIADAGIRFQPPRVDVQSADGRAWRTVVDDAGFPAGMQKTLSIDLGGKLQPGERRIRLVTNLELHWDHAFLSVGEHETPIRTTELAPIEAELRLRGSSRWTAPFPGAPTEPVYADATRELVYDLHVGDVTRYGDVRELLEDADDRSVIFPHGDEVALAFDASTAPEIPEGWTRTFILDSSGWAKDADPNTFAPATVEPLPFHGMSGYPYGAGESFPDDDAHRRYRREWNVRRIESPRPLPVLRGIEAIHER